MKLNRNQIILAVILVAQVALSAVMLWPRQGTAGAVELLFGGLSEAEVVALTITDDAVGSITLRKLTGEWVYPAADDYPADGDRITPLLDKIAALDSRRLVTRTEASHKQLKVAGDDFVRRIQLETDAGEVHTLYLGSSPSYGASHVRVEGTSETYLANDISQWDFGVNPVPWVDGTYFSVPQDDVQEVTLTNANGTFTFVKDEAGSWTLVGLAEDEELDTAEVSSIMSKVTQVTMNRPLGRELRAEYGMDQPLAVVSLKKETETVTLSVGAQDPGDSTYVVIVSTSPYYVRLNEYNVSPLVEDARSDLLVPPPTPTAEETTS